MSTPIILCMDSDQTILDLLRFNLEASGFSVLTATDAQGAVSIASHHPLSLIMLDLMLPDISGHDAIKAFRARPSTADTPIIVLSASEAELDAVLSFELGADDYIRKPFSVRELLARVKAVLRRSETDAQNCIIQVGPLTIDSNSYEAHHKGDKLILTLKEYELLKLLASSPGKVLTRDFLLDRIWGYEFYGETRTVDVHIRHIRQKLGENAGMIETVRGVGYKMQASA